MIDIYVSIKRLSSVAFPEEFDQMAKPREGEPRRSKSRNPMGRPSVLGALHVVIAKFPVDLHERLKAEADKQERSVSDVLREAAEQWLSRR